MRTAKIKSAPKAKTSTLLSTDAPSDFSGLASLANLPLETIATPIVAVDTLATRQRAFLRSVARIVAPNAQTLAVHSGNKSKPLSEYFAGARGNGHQQSALSDNANALAACLFFAAPTGQYNPSTIGADKSKHTSLFLNRFIAIAPNDAGFTLTDSGRAYGQARANIPAIAALGPYPAE